MIECRLLLKEEIKSLHEHHPCRGPSILSDLNNDDVCYQVAVSQHRIDMEWHKAEMKKLFANLCVYLPGEQLHPLWNKYVESPMKVLK